MPKNQGGYRLQRAIAISNGLKRKQVKPKPRLGSKPSTGMRTAIRNVFKIRAKTGDIQLLREDKWKRHIGTQGLQRFE